MINSKWPFTWLEVALALGVLLLICRFVWARELATVETRLFQTLGINERAKFILTAPLVALVIWGHYKDGASQVKGTGRKVYSRPVIAFALISIIIVAAYFVVMSN